MDTFDSDSDDESELQRQKKMVKPMTDRSRRRHRAMAQCYVSEQDDGQLMDGNRCMTSVQKSQNKLDCYVTKVNSDDLAIPMRSANQPFQTQRKVGGAEECYVIPDQTIGEKIHGQKRRRWRNEADECYVSCSQNAENDFYQSSYEGQEKKFRMALDKDQIALSSQVLPDSGEAYLQADETGMGNIGTGLDDHYEKPDDEEAVSYEVDYFQLAPEEPVLSDAGDDDVVDGEIADIQAQRRHDKDGNQSSNSPDSIFCMPSGQSEKLIYPGSTVTNGQVILALLSLILRHGLTNVCVEEMLEIINIICPDSVPGTKHLLFKYISVDGENCKVYVFCDICHKNLGPMSDMDKETVCECGKTFHKSTAIQNGNFFLHLEMESQLRELLPKYKLQKKSEAIRDHKTSSLLNGRMMKEYLERGQISDEDITLLWNCDGAPLFKSSKKSVWPLQARVNELDDVHENRILIGLWVGKDKPTAHCFFKPFLDEMIKLGTRGMSWTSEDGSEMVSRVFAVCCTSDACARPVMKETTQFNGAFGCDFCLQEGQNYDNDGAIGRRWIYPHTQQLTARTDLGFKRDATAAEPKNPVNGVKGCSPLLLLPLFSMTRGFVVDYMHCVLLGVVRMLFGLWFDSKNHAEAWYLGGRETISKINGRLLSMKPPSEISRLPRNVDERKYWKASEYRAFLLYYAMVVLDGIFSHPRYYAHLFLLIYAIQLLSQDMIPLRDIELAEGALYQFCLDMPRLYRYECSTFNVHQLRHLVDCVRDWGSVHGFSCFHFESEIGNILAMVRGTKAVGMQICRTFLMKRYMPRLIVKHFKETDIRLHFLMRRLGCSGHYIRKKRNSIGNVNLYGAPATREMKEQELFAVFRQLDINAGAKNFKFFHSIAIGSLYITSEEHRQDTRHRDSTVFDLNNEPYVIESICAGVLCSCEAGCCCIEKVFIFGRHLEESTDGFYSHLEYDSKKYIRSVRPAQILTILTPSRLSCKAFRMSRRGKDLVAKLPNVSESD